MKKAYGSFDKRSAAEEFVNTLPQATTLEEMKRESLKEDFENVGRLFAVLGERLQKLAGEDNV